MRTKHIGKHVLMPAAISATLVAGIAAPAGAVETPAAPVAAEQNDSDRLFEDQTVVPGHSVSFAPKTPIADTSGADISQHGIPEGWHVTINEENAHVVVSAAPNAKKGDSVTVKIKIVDINGRVERHEVKVTASEDGTGDFAQPPADPDGPKVSYPDATVEPGRSVNVQPKGDLKDDTIYDIAQHDIPKGWYVTVSDAGQLTVSAGMDAKSGDSYTANVKIVDIDGKITWAHPKITVK